MLGYWTQRNGLDLWPQENIGLAAAVINVGKIRKSRFYLIGQRFQCSLCISCKYAKTIKNCPIVALHLELSALNIYIFALLKVQFDWSNILELVMLSLLLRVTSPTIVQPLEWIFYILKMNVFLHSRKLWTKFGHEVYFRCHRFIRWTTE